MRASPIRVFPIARILLAAASLAGPAVVSAPRAFGQTDLEKIAALQKQSIACYEKKDFARFLDFAKQAEALRPGSPALLYNVACGEALTGDTAGAARDLASLFDRKLDLAYEKDGDFAAVRDTPAFEGVRRKAAGLRSPVANGQVAFRLPQKDLLTEGIAYDPQTRAFFVSSVHRRKIVRRGPDGAVSDFVTEGRDGLEGVLGLAVDAKRHLLWAVVAAVPQMKGWEPSQDGTSALVAFDLKSGKSVVRAALPKAGKHVLNDLAIARNGDVYATDSLDSAVYRLRAGATALETFVPPGVFRSPQGVAFAPDGRSVYIADYADGIWLVDLATGKREAVTGPRDVPLQGVDALAIHGRELVVSQNGIAPARIARLTLEASGSGGGRRIVSGEILEMNTPLVEEPTLGVVVGDDFVYVANAQWERFGGDGKIRSEFTEPTIARVALPRR